MTEKRGGFRDRHHNRPHHINKNSSYHPYRSGSNNRFLGPSSAPTNRLVSVHEALKTDRILSIESFANIERIQDTEIVHEKYAAYVKKHQKAHLKNIFNNHKKEKWIINLINQANDPVIDKSVYNSMNWTSETNLKYQESFDMKLEEASIEGNFSTGTETRLYPCDSSDIPESFSSLLPEFSHQIITMSNIPAYVDRESLEDHLKELAPNSQIEITAPNADKSFYRLAWLELADKSSNKIAELVPKLESLGSIEGAKIYFGIASTNFRRFKVTKCIEDESSEDQLYKLAIKLIKLFEHEFDETIFHSEDSVMALDKAVVYLRKVHNFCFYCATKFSCSQEILSKCGDLHLRFMVTGAEIDSVKHDQYRLVERLSALSEFIRNLKEVSSEINTDLDEALTESSIKKVEEGKYRCNHCLKAFKGPEFVLKHLTLKHEDIVKQAQDDLIDFSKFVANSQLWLFPTTMIPRYTRIRNKHHNISGSRDSHGSSKSSLSKGSRSSNKDNYYMDWDAAANVTTSTEINYDL